MHTPASIRNRLDWGQPKPLICIGISALVPWGGEAEAWSSPVAFPLVLDGGPSTHAATAAGFEILSLRTETETGPIEHLAMPISAAMLAPRLADYDMPSMSLGILPAGKRVCFRVRNLQKRPNVFRRLWRRLVCLVRRRKYRELPLFVASVSGEQL